MFDSWQLYTSFPLVNYLSEKKLHSLEHKRKILEEFVLGKHRIVGTFVFQTNKMLFSCVPKKNKTKVLVSNLHEKAEIDGEIGKPKVILNYNSTKIRVDTWDILYLK